MPYLIEVKSLIDGIMEFTDFSTIYTLYVGIVFGLTLKYFWRWKIGYSFVESLSTSSELAINISSTSFIVKSFRSLNPILHFIIRYVRKKYGSTDDPEDSHFLYQP